jgi:chemotaxis protein methyltransferase CheR
VTRRGEPEERELDALLASVRRASGVDFTRYARSTVRRRLRDVAGRGDAGGLVALHARALADPASMDEVVSALCVSVTSMFREPELFRAFREQAVPRLRELGAVRAWHAGCATGEEVWSHAIVLHEEGLGRHARLYGTDLHAAAIARARAGLLPLDRMKEYTIAYQRAGGVSDFSAYYVAAPGGATIRESLRRLARFGRHDLADDPPLGMFDVVFCRNVLIYLDRPLQDHVQEKLARSIRPGGILVLGRAETLSDGLRDSFQEIDARNRLFLRIG